jgi:hypothetical protein
MASKVNLEKDFPPVAAIIKEVAATRVNATSITNELIAKERWEGMRLILGVIEQEADKSSPILESAVALYDKYIKEVNK